MKSSINSIRRTAVASLLMASLGLFAPAVHSAPIQKSPIRIMTFNTAGGAAQPGDDHWEYGGRWGRVKDDIAFVKPDILCLQESQGAYYGPSWVKIYQDIDDWFDWLDGRVARFPDFYNPYGLSIHVQTTVHLEILVNPRKFDTLASGVRQVQTSSTSSHGITWVKLQDRTAIESLNRGKRTFFVVNVHLDHMGNARDEMFEVRRLMAEINPGGTLPTILVGDFNTEYRTVREVWGFGDGSQKSVVNNPNDLSDQWTNRFDSREPRGNVQMGTANGFSLWATSVIDQIHYYGPYYNSDYDYAPTRAEGPNILDRSHDRNGVQRPASDHFAVWADLNL